MPPRRAGSPDPTATTTSTSTTDSTTLPHSIIPNLVVVHPLVLLSVVDHYHRVAHDTSKRVVGVLLGETYKGRVDVSNSFAVPFEEDGKDDAVWFVDHDFILNMNQMFTKVSVKERIVGFYSTGPKLRSNDLAIDSDFRTRYAVKALTPPILVIVDVRPDVQGVPVQAYYSVDTVGEEDKGTKRTFKHVESTVGAYEAEEVGVEHLLRDINDPTVSTLAARVAHKVTGLRGLKSHIHELHTYLSNVVEGKIPVNRTIIANLQEIINLLPNLDVDELVRAMLIKTNDLGLVLFLSSLIRTIVALHSLLSNKLALQETSTTTTTTTTGNNANSNGNNSSNKDGKSNDKKQ
jgi:26S proteasome regulatory subunit N8